MCFEGEPGEMFCSKKRIARKERVCCECLRVIGRGEQFLDNTGMWGGEWLQYPQCMACVEIVSRVVSHELKMGCDEGAYPPFGFALDAWREIERDANWDHFLKTHPIGTEPMDTELMARNRN